MSIQNQADLSRLLQEGVEAVAGARYDMYEPEWNAYLEEKGSKKAYELDVYKATLGTAQLKPEGREVYTDKQTQLYTNTFVHAMYAIGSEITYEAIKNNLYEDEIEEVGNYIEESLQESEQIIAADVINSGYSTFLCGDGEPVFSENHRLKQGVFANRFTGHVDLSEAALEDAVIAVSYFKNAAGLRIRPKVECLIVPSNLQFTAHRLLDSPLQAETSNNAVNALKAMATFPQGYKVSHYFTDPDAWFIKTNTRNGGKFFRREDHMFRSDNSNTNTLNFRSIGTTWFSVGVTDPRCYFGSGPSV